MASTLGKAIGIIRDCQQAYRDRVLAGAPKNMDEYLALLYVIRDFDLLVRQVSQIKEDDEDEDI